MRTKPSVQPLGMLLFFRFSNPSIILVGHDSDERAQKRRCSFVCIVNTLTPFPRAACQSACGVAVWCRVECIPLVRWLTFSKSVSVYFPSAFRYFFPLLELEKKRTSQGAKCTPHRHFSLTANRNGATSWLVRALTTRWSVDILSCLLANSTPAL